MNSTTPPSDDATPRTERDSGDLYTGTERDSGDPSTATEHASADVAPELFPPEDRPSSRGDRPR